MKLFKEDLFYFRMMCHEKYVRSYELPIDGAVRNTSNMSDVYANLASGNMCWDLLLSTDEN